MSPNSSLQEGLAKVDAMKHWETIGETPKKIPSA